MFTKVKAMLAASPLGGPAKRVSSEAKRLASSFKTPELDLFYRDDGWLEEVVRARLSYNANCVDVGCHIGSVLKLFVDVCPGGSHVGVEPTPSKAQVLREQYPGVTLHECAVSDGPGEAVFYENTKDSGYSGLTEQDAAAPQINAYTVQIQTLDSLLADGPVPNIIKIDVEGFELQALKGAAQTIAAHKPDLIFECGPVANEEKDGFSGDDLFNYITKELGYDVYAAIDLKFDRSALTLPEFRRYRTYPFIALNFIALAKS